MILYTPEQFKVVPWKNGKGLTTELATNKDSTIDDFEWRISIADMKKNTVFSKFETYWRNLILLEGNELELNIDGKAHSLSPKLSHISFSGDSDVEGYIKNEPVKNFNVITKHRLFNTDIFTQRNESTVEIKESTVCFIFSINKDFILYNKDTFHITQIDANTLVRLDNTNAENYSVRGENFVLVYLYGK